MANHLAQFIELLRNMGSREDDIRRPAEKIFQQSRLKTPNEIMTALLQVGRTHSEIELRLRAFVIMRKTLKITLSGQSTTFAALNGETKEVFKRELLVGLQKEPEMKVCKFIADVISDFAAQIYCGLFLVFFC